MMYVSKRKIVCDHIDIISLCDNILIKSHTVVNCKKRIIKNKKICARV